MSRLPVTEGRSWRSSRYGLAGFWLLSLMAGWLTLRACLFLQFGPPASLAERVLGFLSGFSRDLFAGAWLTLPLLGWLLLLPEHRLRAP